MVAGCSILDARCTVAAAGRSTSVSLAMSETVTVLETVAVAATVPETLCRGLGGGRSERGRLADGWLLVA